MTADAAKEYLALCALNCRSDIDGKGVDVVPVKTMRWALKRLILRGHKVDCALCGCAIRYERELTLDHIVPRSRGGSDYLHNMQPAHKKCNELKGNTITESDITMACADSNDSVQKITARKKERKELYRKHRNAKWIMPWQIDDHCRHR